MGNIKDTLLNVSGSTADSKWDKFNKDAHIYLDRLIKDGWITKYEVRNYLPGMMNVFYAFMSDKLVRDQMACREIHRGFGKFAESYGITVYDMIYDNQMGLRLTTDKNFERDERNIRTWVDMIW